MSSHRIRAQINEANALDLAQQMAEEIGPQRLSQVDEIILSAQSVIAPFQKLEPLSVDSITTFLSTIANHGGQPELWNKIEVNGFAGNLEQLRGALQRLGCPDTAQIHLSKFVSEDGGRSVSLGAVHSKLGDLGATTIAKRSAHEPSTAKKSVKRK